MNRRDPAKIKFHFSAINLACGGKICELEGWINADHNPSSKIVMKIDLLKKLPFDDESFDVVYHAQFLEHLSYENGIKFLKECRRIMKKNGILRVVTPDLKNQALEYIKQLEQVMENPTDKNALTRYNWIRLEMLDQLTRNEQGGEMIKFLNQSKTDTLKNYLWDRMGRSGKNLIPGINSSEYDSTLKEIIKNWKSKLSRVINFIIPNFIRVGRYRLSGESHLTMFDEYLLRKILVASGFHKIEQKEANKSDISNWDQTLLDCDENGYPDGMVSLFMEARK